jgi:hypothetical protein
MRRFALFCSVALTCLLTGPVGAQSLRDIVNGSDDGNLPNRTDGQRRLVTDSERGPTQEPPTLRPGPAEPRPPGGFAGPPPAACAPPGIPALSELVRVGQQILVAPVEGSDEIVVVDAVGLIMREHVARYHGGDVPPDFVAYYVHGQLAAVDDHPGDPAEPDLVDTGMVSPGGAALAGGTPECRWMRLPRRDDVRAATPSNRI